MAAVARRYEVNANQVFAWRKLFGAPGIETMAPSLVPVVLTGDPPPLLSAISPDERIEIELASGYRVRVSGDVGASTLRRVLDVLERR